MVAEICLKGGCQLLSRLRCPRSPALAIPISRLGVSCVRVDGFAESVGPGVVVSIAGRTGVVPPVRVVGEAIRFPREFCLAGVKVVGLALDEVAISWVQGKGTAVGRVHELREQLGQLVEFLG